MMAKNSSELVTSRRFSRKPSFSQTCNRLSQYLKENGSFRDLSLGIACKPNLNGQTITTMSLFPCEASNSMATMSQNVESKTLFTRQQSFSSSSSSVPKEDVLKVTHTTRSVKQETQTSPFTIFYNGQVIVFNDFSPEKAKEVMNLAKNQTSNIGSLPNQELVQSSSIPMTCELPIARRASLHRFLEKRKDRVMSKAPYQLCDPAKASPKPQTWLGLASEI